MESKPCECKDCRRKGQGQRARASFQAAGTTESDRTQKHERPSAKETERELGQTLQRSFEISGGSKACVGEEMGYLMDETHT